MAGITLAMAESKLTKLLAAHDAITTGSQSYDMDGVSLTRANLAEIEASIKVWDARAKSLSRGGIKVTAGIPLG